MTRQVTFAATQMACSWELGANLEGAERLVREAAERGAEVVLLQELFETPYFPIEQDARHFTLARPFDDHPTIARFGVLAAELGVVLPLSFFERAGQVFFNTVAMIMCDGTVLGRYRKSHIPHAGGYQEKYYFSPGDTGFKVWQTRFGTTWRRHLLGPVVPGDRTLSGAAGCGGLALPLGHRLRSTSGRGRLVPAWQRVQRGQAAANLMPLVASNRIGVERGGDGGSGIVETTFYGSSFISDERGDLVAEATRDSEDVITATFDLDEVLRYS